MADKVSGLENIGNEAFWYRVLQVALAELGIQSFSKAMEISRANGCEDIMELRRSIDDIWLNEQIKKKEARE